MKNSVENVLAVFFVRLDCFDKFRGEQHRFAIFNRYHIGRTHRFFQKAHFAKNSPRPKGCDLTNQTRVPVVFNVCAAPKNYVASSPSSP